ncbi:MAG TPA: transglutaminase family protein [Allosphingosinicella sp.]|jgi:transglutaminase-like putative cysteine protease
MTILTISHVTRYAYRQPVAFGEHRIFVRPRESYDQHLLESRLTIDPEPAELRWTQDVFGNSLALATFDRRAKELRIESWIRMEHKPLLTEEVEIEPYARRYPFGYAPEDMPDLLRSTERQHHDPERILDHWARGFVKKNSETDTLAMLTAMTKTIRRDFTYLPRAEKGTQTPIETLAKRQGTCRDFAVLMMEAVRALGLAARFISGYLYNPKGTSGRIGGGSTHAWVRIFLPGSGWVEFDPTNGIVGNAGLIRVAEARDPAQAIPISGTWSGFPGSDAGMSVDVVVSLDDPAQFTAPPPRAAASRK